MGTRVLRTFRVTYQGWPAEVRVTQHGVVVDMDSLWGVTRYWMKIAAGDFGVHPPENEHEALVMLETISIVGQRRKVPASVVVTEERRSPPGVPLFGPRKVCHLRAPRLTR